MSLKFQYVKNANWVRFPPIVSSLDVELAGAGYTNFRNTSPQGIQNTNLLPQQEDELREIKFFFALMLLSSVCYWLYQTDIFSEYYAYLLLSFFCVVAHTVRYKLVKIVITMYYLYFDTWNAFVFTFMSHKCLFWYLQLMAQPNLSNECY